MKGKPSRDGYAAASQEGCDALSLSELAYAAVLAGLMIGALEVCTALIVMRSGKVVHVSGSFIWMAPLADITVTLAIVGFLFVVGRRVPSLREWPPLLGVFVALAAAALLLTTRRLHAVSSLLLAGGIGTLVWRVASARGLRYVARARRATVLLILGVLLGGSFFALLSSAHDSAAAPPSRAEAPNVLLIILDTVRAKSLSLYGRERQTSPWLEEFGKGSVVFDLAVAPAPWTLPSHASMFTGRHPFLLSTGFETPLDDSYPTLAEELGRHGYATAGFVANLLYTSRGTGLARGFDHYEDYPVSLGQAVLSTSWGRRLADWSWLRNRIGCHELLNRKPAATVLAEFLTWLDTAERRPFFAFINLFDAHEPYMPPAPFDRLFHAPGDRGPLRHVVSLTAGSEAIRPRKWAMTEEDRELDLALYEGGIAYMDDQLRGLFAELERRGVLDRTVVILTSDHGEQFGEHGLYRHINSVYTPLLHVPLVIRVPGRTLDGVRVPVPVSLRQLPATVVDLLDLESTVDFPGPSLAETWGPESVAPPAPFSELVPSNVEQEWYPVAGGRLRSIVSGPYHYIRSEAGAEELYDLDRDPEETVNLIADPGHRAVAASVRKTLDEVVAGAR